MAQRIYICKYCQNEFVLKAWELHRYDTKTSKCHDLPQPHDDTTKEKPDEQQDN